MQLEVLALAQSLLVLFVIGLLQEIFLGGENGREIEAQ